MMSYPSDGTGTPRAPRLYSVTLPPSSPPVSLSSRATNSTVSSTYSSPVSLTALMSPLTPSTSSSSSSATPYSRRSRPTPAPFSRTPTSSPPPSPPPFSYSTSRTSHNASSSTRPNDRSPSAHGAMIPRKGILKEPGSTNRRNGPSAVQRSNITGDDDDGPQVARTGMTMSDIGHPPASHAAMGIGPMRLIPLKSSEISLNWLLIDQESGGSKLRRPKEYASYEKGFNPRFHPRQEIPMRLLPHPAQQTVLSAWVYNNSRYCYEDASSFLKEPASVHSSLRHMTLVFASKRGWTYDLVRPEGIRCIDVLEAIYEMLKASLTADEVNVLARQQTAPMTGRPSRGSVFGASALYFQGLRQENDEVWLVDCVHHPQRWPPQAQAQPQFSSQPQFQPYPQQWAQQFGAYPRQWGWS